jgi:hypothetical protein
MFTPEAFGEGLQPGRPRGSVQQNVDGDAYASYIVRASEQSQTAVENGRADFEIAIEQIENCCAIRTAAPFDRKAHSRSYMQLPRDKNHFHRFIIHFNAGGTRFDNLTHTRETGSIVGREHVE